MRILTASMYYVVAKIQGYTLLDVDVDMLPLQGEHWQTDQMVSTYLALVASRFSRPGEIGSRPRLHGCGQYFYWSWH